MDEVWPGGQNEADGRRSHLAVDVRIEESGPARDAVTVAWVYSLNEQGRAFRTSGGPTKHTKDMKLEPGSQEEMEKTRRLGRGEDARPAGPAWLPEPVAA